MSHQTKNIYAESIESVVNSEIGIATKINEWLYYVYSNSLGLYSELEDVYGDLRDS